MYMYKAKDECGVVYLKHIQSYSTKIVSNQLSKCAHYSRYE